MRLGGATRANHWGRVGGFGSLLPIFSAFVSQIS